MKQKTIQPKDLIFIGVYTAIYFVLVAVSAFFCAVILPGYSYIFIPIVAALLAGPVYMLMAAKVPRFGAITLMGSIVGIYFLIVSSAPTVALFAVVLSMAGDGIAYAFSYKDKKGLLLSYIVFSFNTTGIVLPMIFNPSGYLAILAKNGKSAAHIAKVEASISNYSGWTALILAILLIIASLLGGLAGQRMVKRHFERAGIV